MRKIAGIVVLAFVLGLSSHAAAQTQVGFMAGVELKDASGKVVGTVSLTQEAGGVHVTGKFMGLPPGMHGIHVHAVGSCTPDFAAAGPHFNPMNKKHGTENPEGPHAGDLANLNINADGTGTYDQMDTMISLLQNVPNSVYDADGSAIVVHAAADDYKTDPAGNSGARIACGVIPAAAAAGGTRPGQPSQLPNTGTSSPFLLLAAVAVCALLLGMVVVRRTRNVR